MFGYVRVFRPELKCKDYDLYQATYCGLCKTLAKRYGPVAPMFLSYDLTFLALLVSDPEQAPRLCYKRCHANPFRMVQVCQEQDALNLAADVSVILTHWKLRDGLADDGFWGRLKARFLMLVLKPSYKKAVRGNQKLDAYVGSCLEELSALERENCPSIDRTADTFARLLQQAAPESGNSKRDRVIRQILYHVGRWIYLVDARDDIQRDLKSGAYNPLVARFGPVCDDEILSIGLMHSIEFAYTAFELEEFGYTEDLIRNILTLGLPAVQGAVFSGTWSQLKNEKIRRS